jgi:hypothetical protein
MECPGAGRIILLFFHGRFEAEKPYFWPFIYYFLRFCGSPLTKEKNPERFRKDEKSLRTTDLDGTCLAPKARAHRQPGATSKAFGAESAIHH